MADEADFMSDFGQKVDLCQRIRDVTTNYPEGALLKVCAASGPQSLVIPDACCRAPVGNGTKC